MGRAVVKMKHAYGYWKLCVRGLIKGDFNMSIILLCFSCRVRLVAPSLNFIAGSWGPGACKGCQWLSGRKAGTAWWDGQDADSAPVKPSLYFFERRWGVSSAHNWLDHWTSPSPLTGRSAAAAAAASSTAAASTALTATGNSCFLR